MSTWTILSDLPLSNLIAVVVTVVACRLIDLLRMFVFTRFTPSQRRDVIELQRRGITGRKRD